MNVVRVEVQWLNDLTVAQEVDPTKVGSMTPFLPSLRAVLCFNGKGCWKAEPDDRDSKAVIVAGVGGDVVDAECASLKLDSDSNPGNSCVDVGHGRTEVLFDLQFGDVRLPAERIKNAQLRAEMLLRLSCAERASDRRLVRKVMNLDSAFP